MPLKGFYYAHGDDVDMIEQKWLPDLEKKYSETAWLRYDATIDDIKIGFLTTEYYSNDLFSAGKTILIRNADAKASQVEAFLEGLVSNPITSNAVVLIANGLNRTTRLGKLVKKHFVIREFEKPEIKPFDLLDCLNTKNIPKILQHSNILFNAGYNPLLLFSLIFGHFLLLRKIKEREGKTAQVISREINQHQFRVKKSMVANRFWSHEELNWSLQELGNLDRLLKTWQYDEKMLIQMGLIKLCIGEK